MEARLGRKVFLLEDVLLEAAPAPRKTEPPALQVKLPRPTHGPCLLEFDFCASGGWLPWVRIMDHRRSDVTGVILYIACHGRRPQLVNAGDNAIIALISSGAWYHVKATLPALAPGVLGTYQCVVTGPDGSATSMNQLAFLTPLGDYSYVSFSSRSPSLTPGRLYVDNIRITQLE